jgi:hypothetical protein
VRERERAEVERERKFSTELGNFVTATTTLAAHPSESGLQQSNLIYSLLRVSN